MRCKQLVPVFLATAGALLLSMCDFPYQPKPAVIVVGTTGGGTIDAGTLKGINPGQQICNASVSPDTAGGTYSECMLWLNFDGTLVVDNTASPGYTKSAPVAHDRLTISDTTNAVVWYIMNTDVGIAASREFQDPEWSTHPDYIVCLGNAGAGVWDGYVIRLSDKAFLKFNQGKMSSTSTPHLWVGESSAAPASAASGYDSDGMISAQEIHAFFGTTNVKFVFGNKIGGSQSSQSDLFLIDYSDATPALVSMEKPEFWAKNIVDSPLLSPDGRWVTYNCYSDNAAFNNSYVQLAKAGAEPILLVVENAAEPHWWYAPDGRTFVVYSTKGGTVRGNFPLSADGSLGVTKKVRVELNPDAAASHARFEVVGEPRTIIPLPFRGGISASGLVAVTGYEDAWMLVFN